MLHTVAVILREDMIVGQALRLPTLPTDRVALQTGDVIQKILKRRINSWRASIACAGFIRLRIFSRRSRSIPASSRTSWLRAFHFEYLPAPIPSASSAETTQTVMSVEVTRSMCIENRSSNVPGSQQSSNGTLRSAGAPLALFAARPKSFPKVFHAPRDTAGEAPALPSI